MSFATDHFRNLANYNRWANARLYAACGQLSPEEYFRTRPAFFHSIHRTLNHILVADRIWRSRFEGWEHGIAALNTELYPDFASLKTAREAEDAAIKTFIDGLDDTALMTRPFTYSNSRNRSFSNTLAEALPHFFNHQTHHRGQVHGLLSQTEVPPPELDLIFFQRA